jgi:hypothetical protein
MVSRGVSRAMECGGVLELQVVCRASFCTLSYRNEAQYEDQHSLYSSSNPVCAVCEVVVQ